MEQVVQAYFEIQAIEVGIVVKNDSSVDFEISLHSSFVVYHLNVISDWVQTFSHQKFCIFCSLSNPQLYRNRELLRPISQNHTSRETASKRSYTQMVISQKEGIKLKLKVCSLQWYQKLLLPKMSLVPCFVGVPHICVWHPAHSPWSSQKCEISSSIQKCEISN